MKKPKGNKGKAKRAKRAKARAAQHAKPKKPKGHHPPKGKMPPALAAYHAQRRAAGLEAPHKGKGKGKSKGKGKKPKSHTTTTTTRTTTTTKRNPSLPEVAMRVGKAVGGGFLAAGAVFAAAKVGQKFPAKTKTRAVFTQLAIGVAGGGTLAALGMPAAGALVAAGTGSMALATADGPSPAQLAAGAPPPAQGLVAPVRGLVADNQMRGLVRGLPPGDRRHLDSYHAAHEREIEGLVNYVHGR